MKLRIQSETGALESRLQQAIRGYQRALVARLRTELPWRATAEAALRGVMTSAELPLLDAFLAGISMEPRPADGLTLVLTPPAAGLQSAPPGSAEADRGGRPRSGEDPETRRDRIHGSELDAELDRADAEEAVREWVEAPFTSRSDPASGKDLNAVDMARGPEPIEATVEALLRIMGLVPISPAEQASPNRAAAAVRLQRRVEAFLEARSSVRSGVSLSTDRLQTLVAAVILAWTEMARVEVPRAARCVLVGMLESGALPLEPTP